MKKWKTFVTFLFMLVGFMLVTWTGFAIEAVGMFINIQSIRKIGLLMEREGVLIMQAGYDLADITPSYEQKANIRVLLTKIEADLDGM